jgi:hypothetical protein
MGTWPTILRPMILLYRPECNLFPVWPGAYTELAVCDQCVIQLEEDTASEWAVHKKGRCYVCYIETVG